MRREVAECPNSGRSPLSSPGARLVLLQLGSHQPHHAPSVTLAVFCMTYAHACKEEWTDQSMDQEASCAHHQNEGERLTEDLPRRAAATGDLLDHPSSLKALQQDGNRDLLSLPTLRGDAELA